MSTLGERMEDEWKGARIRKPGEPRPEPISIDELQRRADEAEARRAESAAADESGGGAPSGTDGTFRDERKRGPGHRDPTPADAPGATREATYEERMAVARKSVERAGKPIPRVRKSRP